MQQDIHANAPSESPAITLSAFLETLAAKINRLHEGELHPVVLRGVPIKKPGANPIYGGFFYVFIRDPRTSDTIDAKIPEQMMQEIDWGREALLTGCFRYRVGKKGEVRPELRVDSFLPIAGKKLLAKEDLFARWDQAITRPKRSIQNALLGARPRVALISGHASVAVEDIRAQLKETEEDVELDIRRVSLSRPEEVVRELRQSCNAQVCILTRGGGDDVHDLDAEELIEAVASSPSPVLVAIGHASDQPQLVVGRVADASFPTPTALGAWLFETLKQKRVQAQQLQAAMQLKETNQLREQVGILRDRLQADEQEIASSRRAACEMAALAKRYRVLAWTIGVLCSVLVGLFVVWNLWPWR
jgi:hypothetical protein